MCGARACGRKRKGGSGIGKVSAAEAKEDPAAPPVRREGVRETRTYHAND